MHLEQLQPKKRVLTFINGIALMSHIVESCPRTKLSNNNVDVCRTAPSGRRLKTKTDDLRSIRTSRTYGPYVRAVRPC